MSTKAKPRKAFGTLRDFGNHCFGGAGAFEYKAYRFVFYSYHFT